MMVIDYIFGFLLLYFIKAIGYMMMMMIVLEERKWDINESVTRAGKEKFMET